MCIKTEQLLHQDGTVGVLHQLFRLDVHQDFLWVHDDFLPWNFGANTGQ
jgi:hypothetical protein